MHDYFQWKNLTWNWTPPLNLHLIKLFFLYLSTWCSVKKNIFLQHKDKLKWLLWMGEFFWEKHSYNRVTPPANMFCPSLWFGRTIRKEQLCTPTVTSWHSSDKQWPTSSLGLVCTCLTLCVTDREFGGQIPARSPDVATNRHPVFRVIKRQNFLTMTCISY